MCAAASKFHNPFTQWRPFCIGLWCEGTLETTDDGGEINSGMSAWYTYDVLQSEVPFTRPMCAYAHRTCTTSIWVYLMAEMHTYKARINIDGAQFIYAWPCSCLSMRDCIVRWKREKKKTWCILLILENRYDSDVRGYWVRRLVFRNACALSLDSWNTINHL